MPNPPVLRRNALSGLLDVRRPFSGSLVLPRSMPADRLSVVELSAITAKLGEVTSGTVISGNQLGAHTIIGDGARGGFQMYQAPNMLVFSASPQNGGSMRIGALNEPGITMAGGNVQIDGDATIDGTVRAQKLLFVGGLSQALMTSDRLFIGGGDVDAGTHSGFLARASAIGGFYNGSATWEVNNRSGDIVARALEEPDYGFASIGAGELRISSIDSPYGSDPFGRIVFESWVRNPADLDEVASTGHFYLASGANVLSLYNPAQGEYVQFHVDQGSFAQEEIRLRSPGLDQEAWLRAYVNEVGLTGSGTGTDSVGLHYDDGDYTHSLWITDNEIGASRALYFSATPQPTTLRAGMLWYDAATNTLKAYDGSNVKTVDWT